MESHLSPLQDIVRTTIRDELSRLEPRFQRITMSEDAAGKPAELYGEDGKIYYRKAGGAGEELGVASGASLWESPGAVTELITPEPVLLEDDLTLYDGTSLSPELELKAYDVEGADGVYLTSSTEYFWINRIFDDSILARCDLSSKKWDVYGDLDMNGNDIDMAIGIIDNINELHSYYSGGLDVKDAGGVTRVTLADTTYALICAANINMNTTYKIINLATPTTNYDASTKKYVDDHNWAAADITSGILAVARGGTGVSGDTYDADKVDGYHASSLCKIGSANSQSNHVYFNSGYGLKHSTLASVVLFDTGRVQIDNDVYVIDNCSALSFTDRTPFYSGDALAEIGLIKGNGAGIDHATLPDFVRTEVKKMEKKKGKWIENKVGERNLGNMISMLTVAVQQITGRLETLEKP